MSRIEKMAVDFLRRKLGNRACEWALGGHKAVVNGKKIRIANEIATWGGDRKIKALDGPVEVLMAKTTVIKHEVVIVPETIITRVIVEPGSYVTVGNHDTSCILSVRRHITKQTSEPQLQHRGAESQTK